MQTDHDSVSSKRWLKIYLLIRPCTCTVGQVNLLVYYIKLKSRLSVCPSDRHVDNSVNSAWIDLKLDLCTAVVSGMCMVVLIIS